jgi:site-specific DNA recombinase
MSKQEVISANDKFIKNLSLVLSQYHREMMSEAVKRGMEHRVISGYAISRPPLGYSTTETTGLFKINRQGRALRETLKKLANGETNIESATINIALMFYGLNVFKSWSTIRTKRLLSDPYYAGYISYKGQLLKGLHEPLVTDEEHQKLLALLKNQNGNNFLKSVDKNL